MSVAISGSGTITGLTATGISARPVFTGNILQVVEASTTSQTSTITTIPNDGTIPQNTEGAELMTCAITPTSASNKLLITIILPVVDGDAARSLAAALFQDSTANALSAIQTPNYGAGYPECAVFNHYMTAGTTSSTTFKVRYGPNAGTMYVNRRHDVSGLLGGVIAARITIAEIAV